MAGLYSIRFVPVLCCSRSSSLAMLAMMPRPTGSESVSPGITDLAPARSCVSFSPKKGRTSRKLLSWSLSRTPKSRPVWL